MKAAKRVLIACTRASAYETVLNCISQFYKIDLVDDGWAAIKLMRERIYHTAIIELDLPGKSGFHVARMASHPEAGRPEIPVLLVANREMDGFSGERLSEICYRLAYFPFVDAEFLSIFWAVCDKASERQWESLNPVQSGLLKITKKNIHHIFEKVALEGRVDMGLVKVCTRSVVAAAESNDLNGALDTLKQHHSYSFVHSLKVASVMVIFGRYVGLKRSDLHLLAQGGLLHDIGKFATPLAILDKPGPLTPEEWHVMRDHPRNSEEILGGQNDIPIEVLQMATRHHEKMDGTGYPYGLKGAQLDEPSIITAITDVYSALMDKRSYKTPFPIEKTVEILESMSGHHLEAGLLRKFLEMIRCGELPTEIYSAAAD